MTNLEFEILTFIRDNGCPHWVDVLNAFDPASQALTVDAMLKANLGDKIIENPCAADRPPHCRIRLSGKGRVLLHRESEHLPITKHPALCDSADKNANQKEVNCDEPKKVKFDWFKVMSFFTSLLGFIEILFSLFG